MALVKGRLRVGYTPGVEDAFLFYALLNQKVSADGLKISYAVEPVESLNERSLRGDLDVSVLSGYAFFETAHRYTLLKSGSKSAEETGPIVVSRSLSYPKELKGRRIALPGKWTTAHLLMKIYEPDCECVFVKEGSVLAALEKNEADAAVLIQDELMAIGEEGLTKVIDLGEWLYETTKLPTPSQVCVVRTALGPDLMRKVQRIISESALYARKHRIEALPFVMKRAAGKSQEKVDGLLDRYIHEDSIDMGKEVKKALTHLQNEGIRRGLLKRPYTIQFVPK